MHLFEWGPYKVEYPGEWNELNAKQLLFISSVLCNEMKIEAAQTIVLQHFLNIHIEIFVRIPVKCLSELAETIKFLFEKQELTKQLFPEIKLKLKKEEISFYGPESGLYDLTLEQFFGYSEGYFSLLTSHPNPESMDYLFASLYKTQKDAIFNPLDIEKNMPFVRNLSYEYKYAVLLFYMGCRDLLQFKFPELFAGNGDVKNTDLSFLQLVDNLNNEDLSKNTEIKKSNLYESLIRLSQMIIKQEQQKQNR